MIGKLVTALAGRSVAKHVGGAASGGTGAIIGAMLPVVLPRLARRLGPGGMIAVAVGGWALNRVRKEAEKRAPTAAGTTTPTARARG